MAKHWTERLFKENPDLFKTTLEARMEKTEVEVEGLAGLLAENGVHAGSLVLDLACGIGRISIPLAKLGYKVVGVDLSPAYVARAKEYAEEEGVSENTSFLVGDMREVSKVLHEYVESFDAVINMWTSMGYWDEETDLDILRQCRSLTKSGGLFIMHTANRDYLIKKFSPRDYEFREDGTVVLMDRSLDLETSRMINYWSYYRKEGEDLRYLNTMEINHRIYSLHELLAQFKSTGWSLLAYYGGLDQRKFSSDTFGMAIVVQK